MVVSHVLFKIHFTGMWKDDTSVGFSQNWCVGGYRFLRRRLHICTSGSQVHMGSEYIATGTLKTISSLSAGDHHDSASASVMFAALIWVQPGCCRETVSAKRVERGAGVISLGGDTFCSSPLSLHSMCSVSRWDQEGGAVEGKGRVQHRHAWSRRRGRWGCRREMGRKRAVHGRYQPMP